MRGQVLCCANRCGMRGLAAVALLLAGAVTLAGAQRQPSPAARPPAEQIAVVHGRPYAPHGSDGGDIALVSAAGGPEQIVTTGRKFNGLASDGKRLACIDRRDYNVYVLAPPTWKPERVTTGGVFGDRPCWLPGKNQLLCGRGALNADAGDGGLWLIDLAKRSTRRVLPPFDGDNDAHRVVKVSPHGTRAVAGGGMDFAMQMDVVDLNTARRMRQPGTRGLIGVTDFAWLDDDDMLVASTPQDDPIEHRAPSQGGIRRLSLRTRRFTGWWRYPSKLDVDQIQRSAAGDRFAVGVDDVDAPAAYPRMAKRLLLLDARTRASRPIRIPGPSHAGGVSPDGARLRLLIMTTHTRGEETRADAYVIDLRAGAQTVVARDVIDAIWMGQAPVR